PGPPPMGAYLARRLLLAIPTMVIVYTLAFLLVHATPGGPWDNAEKPLAPQVIANLKAKYHLDAPLWTQYLLYLDNALHGSLGPSYVNTSQDVSEIIAEFFPVSTQLGAAAMLFAIAVGIPLGTLAAVYRNTPVDYVATGIVVLGISIPNYVMATLLVTVFAVLLHWLPTGGWRGLLDIRVLIPMVAIGFRPATTLARYLRTSLLEVLHQDYIRTARAKGLAGSRVIVRHGLRNALTPIATVSGILVADVITGSFFVETITRVPGIGRYFVTATTGRDYPVLLALALLFALIIITMNILVDLSYAALDPQVRYG
ncbi:MAG TPA: ABC transporter permease, partial [bacterium]|nr:ABC transporter permease [bacterium]